MLVECGSLWKIDDSSSIIGADHHLDNLKTGAWIEISDESFENDFILIKEAFSDDNAPKKDN
jgi:hypothetical protein